MNSESRIRMAKPVFAGGQGSIETLFSELAALETAARHAALLKFGADQSTLRAELESLLAYADQANDFLSLSPVPAFARAEAALTTAQQRERLGPYRIVRELGRGGMGMVFLAERADGEYQKQVAIKLVSHSLHSEALLRRFTAERQILARLEHPNIAVLLDGGTTEDGCPYLVMEYVPGEPIDLYCRTRQLSIRERLELFIQVCGAVQYAHQKLIVHRDLKPANILVTRDGVPKLLDFGIAKLLEEETPPGACGLQTGIGGPLMTPEYASPEQVLGNPITTATDVYALGVMLYELLTGRRPYDLNQRPFVEIARTICEVKVSPPSSRNRSLRKHLQGDLDNITLLALRKEPERRYQSVQNLACDLENFLQGRPVSAAKDAFSYRLSKFITRNRLGVALGMLALVALLAGSTVSTWQWQVARAEQRRAERHYNDIRRLANTIVFEVTDAVAELPGSTRVRESFLDKGLAYLDTLARERRDDPGLQNDVAEAYYKLAGVQGIPIDDNLGNPSKARGSLRKAIAIWKSLTAANPAYLPARIGLAQSYKRLSAIHGARGNFPGALRYAQRCVSVLEPYIAAKPVTVRRSILGCHTASAHWLTALNQYSRARQHLLSALDIIGHDAARSVGLQPFLIRIHVARIDEEWAEIAAKTGDLEKAVWYERERLAALQTLPEDHLKSRRLADAYQGLAARLATAGKIDRALRAYHEGLALWSARANKYPDDIRPRQGMAGIYADLAKWHGILSRQVKTREAGEQHRKNACSYFRKSQRILDSLSNPSLGFGMRYSWLQNPLELMDSLADQCRLDEIT